ncbi:hypothetical protein [Roseisolibacter agri]|uniref:Type II secretion system protein GspC N-terminal domain-containing protein n=1 Tax=Roseisolibacter agri TaxID=2014610 RepID=A0AA37QD74_9BACT|nr:hypothetical protein [Roseisolibacter agri]GLC24165.1 hypothetical protein rosag_06780 [Roseisolibacter agri]
MAPRRLADALSVAALAIGAIGAALWLWPARVDVAPLRPVLASAPATGAGAEPPDPARALRVAESNPFAPTRTAPRARWVPPDALGPMADVTISQAPPPGLLPDPSVDVPGTLPALEPPTPAPAAVGEEAPRDAAREATARARDRKVPALFGTVIGADGARALLRLDARVPGAQLYAEGAQAGGWRVQRVEADRVTLVGHGRTVTLRMPRPGVP